jgi:hypothetical protein
LPQLEEQVAALAFAKVIEVLVTRDVILNVPPGDELSAATDEPTTWIKSLTA